ncbi:exoribonuclease II KNAG_0E01140 [Huiozyma naganishii CBS 8797]|uniref:RNB domain-containing protein n=1 Tax=Huiozyma naganishii (strain ATCC MYA-139 / BCRC 22969 / CBS 8797 / KCTC 17520 / NBRC 10181 / NCYC 3082 / Yp74L-3) TaxID=1071383 RepID=J7S7K1_HUIN7|nr:hypothetical protein KNAG_0E01140 [Kazachstania naganishii CBS 8797]CCK70381.1 hypothetical protein KNAG_0E01140 [Kazachstania naganishii CBS 8797]
MSQWLARRSLHTGGVQWRKVLPGNKRWRKSREKVVSSSDARTPTKNLDAVDIERINEMFLSRTKDLEPGMEIKKLKQIKKEFNTRFAERYFNPSKQWFQDNWVVEPSTNTAGKSSSQNSMTGKNKHYTFKLSEFISSVLQMGDLVLTTPYPNELAMCVGLPESAEDPRYTFVTVSGKMFFGTKSFVHLRIPYRLPEKVRYLISKEGPHAFEPVGTIKGTRDVTYILPYLARQLVTSELPSQINKLAWQKLPSIIKRLELLSRYLRKYNGTWQVPFVQLVDAVQRLEEKGGPGEFEYIKSLFERPSLGSRRSIHAATYLATYWAIKEQQNFNIWGKIHVNKAFLAPISTSVVPAASLRSFHDELINDPKRKHVNKITDLINTKDYELVRERYPEFLQLLSDFTAGNFDNNCEVVTLISQIFRMLDVYRECNVTRDTCFDLLKEISEDNFCENPILSNSDLALAQSSERSALQKCVYSVVQPDIQLDTKTKRHDFLDMPVYCIDSETAHEIDDGVSIEKNGKGSYTLHVHIADPASFFPESYTESTKLSDVLKIAFDKSFTTYLPDVVEAMLPESFCRAADLGKQDKKTRTITFSVRVKMDEHGGLHIQSDTFRARLGLVSNFPKVTYNIVDSVLNDSSSNSPLRQDLLTLYKIASGLRHNRVKLNGAVVFGEGFNNGQVRLIRDSANKVKDITFENNNETPSTVLVSELMILANTLSGNFFRENKIPGIFRCYNELKLDGKALSDYRSIQDNVQRGKNPTLKDIAKITSLMNSSFYSGEPRNHQMIGAKQYLTVTSPLRRYPDLINHIQLHKHLANKPLTFSQQAIDQMIWQVQSRADILKSISTTVSAYWTLTYLKKRIEKDSSARFDVMVTSFPQDGMVNCLFPNHSYARGKLKLKVDRLPPQIGDIVKDCQITSIDCLDSNLQLVMV